MMSALPNLAPWWSAEKCRQHHPYRSRATAERMAGLHPISAPKCPKCDAGQRIEAFRCHSDLSHWHIGHGEFWAQEDTPMAVPVQTIDFEARRPTPRGKKPKLTVIQAREIFKLAQVKLNEAEAKRIGALYDVSFATVYDIARGRTYGWATTDLRAAAQTQGEDTTVQITTPPTVMETMCEDDYHALNAMPGSPFAMQAALVSDLADAISVLLECREKPLPKFVTLDLAAIRALVEQARAAS